MSRPYTYGDPRWRVRIAWRFGGSNPRRQNEEIDRIGVGCALTRWVPCAQTGTMCTPEGHHAFARRTPRAGQMSTTRRLDERHTRVRRAPHTSQTGTTRILDEHCVCTRQAPHTHNSPAHHVAPMHTLSAHQAYMGLWSWCI